MAHPFGGHPTFRRFVEYAQENGCTLTIEARQTKAGRAYEAYELRNPNGGRLVVPNPDLDKHLVPSIVTHYQRRLGIKTPFATLPEAGAAEDVVYTFADQSDA